MQLEPYYIFAELILLILSRTAVFLALLNVLEYVQHEPWPNLLYATPYNWKEPVCQNRYKRMAIVEALVTAGNKW